MAQIKPFQGLRYNSAKLSLAAGNIEEVVCPPEDLVGREAQKRYIARNPYNIGWLETGEVLPDDSPTNNRYSRAAKLLNSWEAERFLLKEAQPGFYLYEQEFHLSGQFYRRQALIAALRLEDYNRGKVLPHERTLPQIVTDRMALLQAIKTNLSPVFCLYDDPNYQVGRLCETFSTSPPLYQFADEWGVLHRLYYTAHPATLEKLTEIFASKKLYLADGHHRYQSALDYSLVGPAGAHYIMAGLTSFQDDGLFMLPLHRLVSGLTTQAVLELERALPLFFELEQYPLPAEINLSNFVSEMLQVASSKAEKRPVLGLYKAGPDGQGQLIRLTLKSLEQARQFMPPYSQTWRELEVSLLDCLILNQSLRKRGRLDYTRDINAAIKQVDQQRTGLAFLLPPTALESMRTVAEAQEQMPPKSSYFYPKFMTGLIMRSLL